MASSTIRTIDFLPEIFQTPTNAKFLNATLDQLVSEPNFKQINGYVGRKFAPTFKVTDNYIQEPTSDRQNYQLEPGVVVSDSQQNVLSFNSYSDLIQQIQHYGGITTNQSRLFNNESYTFDGLIDYDKLVNFSQYYWLPTGPDSVMVSAGKVANVGTFHIHRNEAVNAYVIDEFGTEQNPTLTLVRGGVYNFIINQSGNPFWIQTQPGLSGVVTNNPNVSTRDVFGVSNNGVDNAVVTFAVPQSNGQDYYIQMPMVQTVDYAVSKIPFTKIDNNLVSVFMENYGGFDGPLGITDTTILSGKYLVFVDNDQSSEDWIESGSFAHSSWEGESFDNGKVILPSQYTGVWQIQIENTGDGDQLIHLVYIQDIPVEHKVMIKSGKTFSGIEFYKTPLGTLDQVPVITAQANTLFYNDGNDQGMYGEINLVDSSATLNVENDILGKLRYISPNQVTFTNGLKITFDDSVFPVQYQNQSYYVEGVGTGIRLVNINDLITPEFESDSESVPWDIYGFDSTRFDGTLNGPTIPDYIVINRSSLDCNAWSRSNRWFHSDIINLTAQYNKSTPIFDQSMRAIRPIIEFKPDLHLFNYGRISRSGVDILDFTIRDALNQIEGATSNQFNDIRLSDGMTIIFANDFDPNVRNQIYQINILNINGGIKIHLTEVPNGIINQNDSVIPNFGVTVRLTDPVLNHVAINEWYNPIIRNIDQTWYGQENFSSADLSGVVGEITGLITATSFWFNGTTWVKAQQKTTENVQPKFDVVDVAGRSFGDPTIYENTTFEGCQIFSYGIGSGSADSVLGFPLKYRNFTTIGDIEFQNNFDTDTFTYDAGLILNSVAVNTGFIDKTLTVTTSEYLNLWNIKTEPSKQYQILTTVVDGTTPYIEIDITPDTEVLVPNMKVYVNNLLVSSANYTVVTYNSKTYVNISSPFLLKNDVVSVLIYSSNKVSNLGHYEVPTNLDYNSLNTNFQTLSLGQFRNHLTTIASNSNELTGVTPGPSNLRDLDIISRGGNILQHSAPIIYSELFLLNSDLNFINAITTASNEYSKFKSKFLNSYSAVINAGITDPAAGVDLILSQLNAVKNSTFPWYYSDMVPYGSNTQVYDYTVLQIENFEYSIEQIFDDEALSNQAILVYLNGKQLCKGIDYSFSKTRPTVILTTAVNYKDNIKIVKYLNTDGCYIPETPTKLGLYPKFTPSLYLDDSYVDSIQVIRGHDGSITPAFGDFRDQLLLELEKRIYNNIKVTYDPLTYDINDYLPGRFRNTDYSRSEFTQIISRCFMSWAGSSRIDFSSNQWFSSSNEWTWTYNQLVDATDTSSFLPGYWRGIYKYYYDTDAPHLRPWESLGFTDMPDWWIDTYGPAPYTGGNLVLWKDLEQGIIRNGPRAGTWAKYARPGITSFIPVTDSGTLRSPVEFAVRGFNGTITSSAFQFGDEAPVETAWRRSSDYPFAVQQAIALMKPGIYFGLLANRQNYYRSPQCGQFLNRNTNQHIGLKDLVINGQINIDGTISRNAGYLNWVADYLQLAGSDPVTTIQNILSNIDIRLGYRAAGFTDKTILTVLAEQTSPTSTNASIIIPNDDYSITLHKSSPVTRIVYSAVIIEKTTQGYTVSGYDVQNPFFTIVPSISSTNQYTISASGATGVIYNDYQPTAVSVPYGYEFKNRQQVVDFLVSYGRFLSLQGLSFDDYDSDLSMVRNWVLSATEFLTWTQQGWGVGNVIVLSPTLNNLTLNYSGAVVDAITNTPLGSKVLDVGFNVIKSSAFTVSRIGPTFTLTVNSGITIGLIDLSLVQYEHALIFKNETMFNDIIYKPEMGNRQYRLKLIGSKTADWDGQLGPAGFIYNSPTLPAWSPGNDYLKGEIVTYKSLNYTALQDIVASPTFNFSQWSQLNTSSFKTGLLPNLAFNAEKFTQFYDIDNQLQNQNVDKFAMGLIGYRDRSYLDDLSLNPTTQSKFYQGYIRNKGTPNAINALINAQFDNLNGSLTFSEEWAFRVGQYGAVNSNQFFEVALDDSLFTTEPMTFTLLPVNGKVTDKNVVGMYNNTLFKTPLVYNPTFMTNRSTNVMYDNDIRTAGYVHLDDVDATIFDITQISSLNSTVDQVIPNVKQVGSGYRIWVANDTTSDWNVYRVNSTSCHATQFLYTLDGTAQITTDVPHPFTVNDNGVTLFVIQNFNTAYPEFDGFYIVSSVIDSQTILVNITPALESLLLSIQSNNNGQQVSVSSNSLGTMYTTQSVRAKFLGNDIVGNPNQQEYYQSLSDITANVPTDDWAAGDVIWVDNATGIGQWAVYQKTTPWVRSTVDLVPDVLEQIIYSRFGQSTVITDGEVSAIVGAPGPKSSEFDYGIRTGELRIFKWNDATHEEIQTVTLNLSKRTPSVMVGSFGSSLDSAGTFLVTGAPDSTLPGTASGLAAVYEVLLDGTLSLVQILSAPTIAANDSFGYSVSMSEDSKWIYIGAPGNNGSVYAYSYQSSLPFHSQSIYAFLATPGNTVFTLDPQFNLTSPTTFLVTQISSLETTILTPEVDYVLDLTAKTITFTGTLNINDIFEVQQSPGYALQATIAAPTANTQFGYSIDTNQDGSILLVGSIGNNSAYVYTRSGSTFTSATTLAGENNSRFGTSVSMSKDGTQLFVSAPISTVSHPLGTVARFCGNSVTSLSAPTYISPPSSLGNVTTFGSTISYNDELSIIGVSSSAGVTLFEELPKFDSNLTTNPTLISFVEHLTGQTNTENFGSSIAIKGDKMIIGANAANTDAGLTYVFGNLNNARGWNVLRSIGDKVDLEYVNKLFCYSESKQILLAGLDYIDPAKGKILGVADQDITYKTEFDPATYNQTSETIFDSSIVVDDNYFWGENQVGQVWWNLSKVRFIEYEQDTLTYRINNWGKMFPGSTVEVNEWVQSKYLPSDYVANTGTGSGIPKYANNEAYVQKTIGGQMVYFYWVTGKETVDYPFRNTSIRNITDLLSAPQSQSIPYAAIIRNDSISLFNTTPLVSANDTIFHIDYASLLNENVIHNEYELVSDDPTISVLPDQIVNKLIDSLTGETSPIGQNNSTFVVPDPNLKVSERYGIQLRPRQTMFVDRLQAVQNLIQYVNTSLRSVRVVGQFDLSTLKLAEPMPKYWDTQPIGRNITVTSTQQLNLLDPSTLLVGQRIRLLTSSTNWTIYEVRSNYSFTPVGMSFATLADRNSNVSVLQDGMLVYVQSDSDYNGLWTIYQFTGDTISPFNGPVQIQNNPFEQIPLWDTNPIGLNISVQDLVQLSYLNTNSLVSGQRILVQSDADYLNQWTVYQIIQQKSLNPVMRQNGPLESRPLTWDINIFSINQSVPTYSDLLLIPAESRLVGQRILVVNDSTNQNRWTIYQVSVNKAFVQVLSQTSPGELPPATWDINVMLMNLEVSNYADLISLPTGSLVVGQRILVAADVNHANLWTIYEVSPTKTFILKITQYINPSTGLTDIIDTQPINRNISVDTHEQLLLLDITQLVTGQRVLVRYDENYNNKWTVYQFLANSTFEIEQIQATDLVTGLPQSFPINWDTQPINRNVWVSNLSQLAAINPTQTILGQRILVIDTSSLDNDWVIYEVQNNISFKVVQTQSYKTTDYWSFANWYDSSYDPSSLPNYTVPTMADMAALTLTAGQIVYVTDAGKGLFAVYRVNSDLTTTIVSEESGTIQLSDSLWSQSTNSVGFDNSNFDEVKFDLNPTTEFRNIINAIKDNIFVGSLGDQFNKLFFTLLNYILTEQVSIDWAFKTSFISIVHNLRKLAQYPSYIKDNQTYYEDYINEVKPYRTKVREYLIDYQGFDVGVMASSDFDLQPYYDTEYARWRSPNGEEARDALIVASNPQYSAWLANHSYQIDSVIVDFGGKNYNIDPYADPNDPTGNTIITPKVQIYPVMGGIGIGAKLQVVLNATGGFSQVIVVDSGIGYVQGSVILVADGGIGTGADLRSVIDPVTGGVLRVDIISPGANYAASTTISVEAGGQHATLEAVVDYYLQSIVKVNVIDPGYGYTSTPKLVVNASGKQLRTTGTSGSNYWMSMLGDYNTSDTSLSDIAVDSAGNIYVTGSTGDITLENYQQLVLKYNSNGVLQWQSKAGPIGGSIGSQSLGICLDSVGNVYTVGIGPFSSSGFNLLTLYKYTSNGQIQWVKTLSVDFDVDGFSICSDSNNYIYVSGIIDTLAPGGTGLVAKYNSNGDIQWQRRNMSSEASPGVTTDSSNNVYVASYGYSMSSTISKFDSNGNFIWQREISGIGTSPVVIMTNNAVDSFGNIYSTGYWSDNYVNNIWESLLTKHDSSGNLIWQRSLSVNSFSSHVVYVAGLVVDDANRIYITGSIYTPIQLAEHAVGFVVVYDSNGSILWQRELSSSDSTWPAGIAVDQSSIYLIVDMISSTANTEASQSLTLKLPIDGSMTGNIGSLTYQTSTLTSSVADITSTIVNNSFATALATPGTLIPNDSDSGLAVSTISLTGNSSILLTESTTGYIVPAICYPKLTNKTVRSLSTTIKLDRVSYTSGVMDWKPYTAYSVGTVVDYQGAAYTVNTPIDNNQGTFIPGYYTYKDPSSFITAADRTMALYSPTVGMFPKDLDLLFTGLNITKSVIHGGSFNQVSDSSGNLYTVTDQNGQNILVPVDTSMSNTFGTAETTTPNAVGVPGSSFLNPADSHSPEELIPGLMSDTLDITVFTVDNASVGGSTPDVGTHLNQITGQIVVSPVGYDFTVNPVGFRVTKTLSYYEGSITLDLELAANVSATEVTSIHVQSQFDLLTSSRPALFAPTTPGSIIINGEYISYTAGTIDPVTGILTLTGINRNTTNSAMTANRSYATGTVVFATETTLASDFHPADTQISVKFQFGNGMNRVVIPSKRYPGSVYINGQKFIFTGIDRVNQKLTGVIGPTTTIPAGTQIVIARKSNIWEYRCISAENTTRLAQDLNIDDTKIYVTDVTALPVPAPSSALPGIIYINGEKIFYYVVSQADNSLSQISRGVQGTGSPAVHKAGLRVVAAGPSLNLPELVSSDNANTPWDGGLYSTNSTGQANFMRSNPTYLPRLPTDQASTYDK